MDTLFSLHSVTPSSPPWGHSPYPVRALNHTLDHPSVKKPFSPCLCFDFPPQTLSFWMPSSSSFGSDAYIGPLHKWIISSPCLYFDSLFQDSSLCHCPLYLCLALTPQPRSVPKWMPPHLDCLSHTTIALPCCVDALWTLLRPECLCHTIPFVNHTPPSVRILFSS